MIQIQRKLSDIKGENVWFPMKGRSEVVNPADL